MTVRLPSTASPASDVTKGRTGNNRASASAAPKRRRVVITGNAKRLYLEALAEGWSHDAAAKRSGHSARSFRDLRQRDEGFAVKVMEAYDQGTDTIEDDLRRLARDGNVTAVIFALKNRRPKVWRDRHEIEHSGIPEPDVTRALTLLAEAAMLESAEARAEQVQAVLAELASEGPKT